ncbi:YeiH family protein [Psychromonas sp. CD1]|uniref:YeiH family protein n=1 Tax=Psychromonas sp. CD1 TaxID=1979839 RepID=UPI000B9BF274|nr:putative sulfate exporter family transporter [Psychromonas sp. CD1]
MQHPSKKCYKSRDLIFFSCALLCLSPFVNSPVALILGFMLLSFGLIPEKVNTGTITKKLLAYSIIGLGFGINLDQAIEISKNAIGLICTSIFGVLIIGTLLTKWLKIDAKMGHLIASGTAICGGSAIAAVAPAIKAKNHQISHALAVIFILNSIALFVFPYVGHLLHMSQHAFGTWCAIAIHDTSSVVGAASAYGDEALRIATTLKLSRALWIVPLALISALAFKEGSQKIRIPFFIVFYCLAILVSSYFPQGADIYSLIFNISKHTLVLCLFLIGASISLQQFKEAGYKPLLLGISLWLMVSICALIYIQIFL